ncbi:Mut7-C RNAse domain-containing protein [bacterium]|nr:Mut7-C RNAse domain-containing protein [bacterium]
MNQLSFIADIELKPLVKLIRMLGINCRYDGGMSLPEIITIATSEQRILLTLKSIAATQKLNVFRFSSYEPIGQLRQLNKAFNLKDLAAPFSRCLICNAELIETQPTPDVPNSVLKRNIPVYRCTECRRLFWHGTHIERMKDQLLEAGIVF